MIDFNMTKKIND